MNWRLSVLLGLGCTSDPILETGLEPCVDSDGDGICDAWDACEGADDARDSDEDGVPDACEQDSLGMLQTDANYLDTSSTQLSVQLAYDTHLAMSLWLIFEPGLLVSEAEPTVTVWTRDLDGWFGVQERLTDGEDQDFCTYVTGLDDDFHQALTLRESYFDMATLEGAVVNSVRLEAEDWHQDDDQQVITFRWWFQGILP